MSTVTPSPTPFQPPVLPTTWSIADLVEHLGNVPPERIHLYPPPGMATVADALRLIERGEASCELVDGVLVEKPMGTYEALLAMVLGHLMMSHLDHDNQGVVLGEQGMLQILPSKMRMPDVSFIRWERFPDGKLPSQRVYGIAPDLAVEIVSAGNTPDEMQQKLDEYFEAGVRLVWYIVPESKTARIYSARDQVLEIDESGTLDGGEVLPGFQVQLGALFRRAKQSPG